MPEATRAAATDAALVRLNFDLGVFLLGLREDERRRLEHQLRQQHGF